jgi:hypothetical protein
VAAVVVVLDVVEVDGLGDARVLVQLARVGPQVRVVDEPPEVALEVADIDRIEADQGGEQPPVGLGEPVAEQIALADRRCLQPVERLEQRQHRFLVGLLGGGEAGLVDAVVDVS